MADRRGRRAGSPTGAHRYPRTARVNEVLREIIAESLERKAPAMVTVTAVEVDPDLRHAKVWLSSLSAETEEALDEMRPDLQRAIARQARMKRTPLLSFAADPAVANGARIDDIIRGLED